MEILTPLTLWLWNNNVVTFELSVLIKHYCARLSEKPWITFISLRFFRYFFFFPPLQNPEEGQSSSLLFSNADMFLHAFIPWISFWMTFLKKLLSFNKVFLDLLLCSLQVFYYHYDLLNIPEVLVPLFVGFSPSTVLSRLRSYAVPYYTVCWVLHQWAKTTGCSKDGHKWWFELVPSWSLEKI